VKKMYGLHSILTGDLVGIAYWDSAEVELVRGIYKRNNILITEKIK